MKATSLMKSLKGIEKIITKCIGRHVIRQAMSDLIETNDRFTPYSVEKLCFEKRREFICDLSSVPYASYEGGSRSRVKIRPNATQNGTIDL